MGRPALLWKKLKYHGLNGGERVRGQYLMAPVSCLAEAFGGEASYGPDRLSAVVRFDREKSVGRRCAVFECVQFARGSIGAVCDGYLRQMLVETIEREDELYVSAEWFAEFLFDMHVSCCDGVLYATDHASRLSLYMADLIRDILTDRAVPDNFDEMGACLAKSASAWRIV